MPKEAAARRLEELGLKKPYSDPSLRSRKKRQALVKALDRAGLLGFSQQDGVRVGIFTVWKKGRKKQRVIVDARLSNAHFEEPESVSLPSAQNLSDMHVNGQEMLHLCASDLKDAFYTMELPKELGKFFTLEPLLAK